MSNIYIIEDSNSKQGFYLAASDQEINIKQRKKTENEFKLYKLKETQKQHTYEQMKRVHNVSLEKILEKMSLQSFKYNQKLKTYAIKSQEFNKLLSKYQTEQDKESSQSEEVDQSESEEQVQKPQKKLSRSSSKIIQKQKMSEEIPQKKTNARSKSAKPAKGKKQQEPDSSQESHSDNEVQQKKQVKNNNKRKQSKQQESSEEDEQESESEVQQKKKNNKTKQKKPQDLSEQEQESENEVQQKKKNNKTKQKKSKDKSEKEQEQEEAEEEEKPKQKQKNPRKKTTATKKKAQTEDEQSEQEEEEEEQKSKSKPKKGKNAVPYKKGQFNERIPKIIETNEIFESHSNKINEDCCVRCTNYEVLRAINTGNHTLLKSLLHSKDKISTLFAKQGPDSNETSLELILNQKDKKALQIFIDALENRKDLQFAIPPACTLDEIRTGYNDRFAYGVVTRKVHCSRGGKEGNNAFVADLQNEVQAEAWAEDDKMISNLLEKENEIELLNFLRVLKNEQITQKLLSKIYVAVRAGNRKVASYLMEQTQKLGGYGYNKVHEQVLKLDDPSKMEEFKKVSVTKKSTGTYGQYGGGAQGVITPLHCAAINPNVKFLQKLLEIQPEYSICDDLMRKPIHYAAACEGPAPLKFLLEQGVDSREGDRAKMTTLMIACQFGRAKNVEILLQQPNGCNPDARTRDGMRAVHFAAFSGHLNCVQLLLDKVNVESPGAKRMTALHFAASRGYFDMVKYLVEDKKASVLAKDKFRRTPLVLACANGHIKIASYLLKHGSPFDFPDSSSNYPVHYAAAYGFHNLIDLLIQAGANINVQNAWKLSPLSVALAKGHQGIVKKLLNRDDCDVNCKDVQGRTVVVRATEILNEKYLDQFEYLLKVKKADPNLVDNQGRSPLHYICSISIQSYCNKENKGAQNKKILKEYDTVIQRSIQILIESGANINLKNLEEKTGLIIAVESLNYLAANYIIDNCNNNDFSFHNSQEKNILHFLKGAVSHSPEGIDLAQKIINKIPQEELTTLINKVDINGFSPILYYVLEFSLNCKNYFEQQRSKMVSEILKDQKVKLTEAQNKQITEECIQKLNSFIEYFQKFIEFLVQKKANWQEKVNKRQKKEDYNQYGEQNIWNLCINFPYLYYLQFFAETFPSLIHNQDYMQRNSIQIFVNKIQEGNLTPFEQTTQTSLQYLCQLHLNINQRDALSNTPIITSTKLQKYEFSRILVQQGCELKVTNKFNESPLILAINQIQNNNLDFVQFLLNNNADPNYKDIYGRTALHHAISVAEKGSNASFDLERLLLQNGAHLNAQDCQGRTPLHYTFISVKDEVYQNTQYDPFETVSSLCDQSGIDINIQDIYGRTPLHYAAQKNSTISTIYMIEKKANVNVVDNNGNTPLSTAFMFQRNEMVTTLIQNNARTDQLILIKKHVEQKKETDEEEEEENNGFILNRPRKSKAIKYNNNMQDQNGEEEQQGNFDNFQEDTYKALINKKPCKQQDLQFKEFKYDFKLKQGTYSYFKAAIIYQWQGIAYLLLIKSNYSLFDALNDAIQVQMYQLAITLLNKYKENTTIQQESDQQGRNLILILCKQKNKQNNKEIQLKLLELLMERGLNVFHIDKEDNSALHYAYIDELIAKRLLEKGLNPNAYNKQQNTPFSLALIDDAKMALKIYENFNPDYQSQFLAKIPNLEEQATFKPFVWLIAQGKVTDEHFLQKWLDRCQNINEVDSNNRNSLYYAILHNNIELIRFLIKNGISNSQIDYQGKNAVHYVVNPVEFGSFENTEILDLLYQAKFDFLLKDNEGFTPLDYANIQQSGKLAKKIKELFQMDQEDQSALKKFPRRVPTSIVYENSFPTQLEDVEADSQQFIEDTQFDQFKEFYGDRQVQIQYQIDQYVSEQYKKSQNKLLVNDNNEPYNIFLTKVDLGFGGFSKYVFYIMQIVHDKQTDVFILFTRWGQIGTMGQFQHTPFVDKAGAIKEFEKIFLQKTGNEYSQRENFEKKDKKYQLLKFSKEKDRRKFKLKPFLEELLIQSQLDQNIYKLMKSFCDSELYKRVYRQLNLDDSELPITKLVKSQLQEAQNVLNEILENIQKGGELRTKMSQGQNLQKIFEINENIMNLSSRYFELVPHSLNPGAWYRQQNRNLRMQMLNNEYQVRNEQQLISSLLDVEAAIKILMGAYTKLGTQNPYDYCFNALNVRCTHIPQNHHEYRMINQYIRKTCPRASVSNLYAVERNGEGEKIKQFSHLQKKLLFHGSGVQNFLSILNFGLRIKGINANISGSSLGDGIYFSDLFRKASQYANNDTLSNNKKYILLCDVAIGTPFQVLKYDQYQKVQEVINNINKKYNSVQLVGYDCPDESKNLILNNGSIIPIGDIVNLNNKHKNKKDHEKQSQKNAKQKKAKVVQKKKQDQSIEISDVDDLEEQVDDLNGDDHHLNDDHDDQENDENVSDDASLEDIPKPSILNRPTKTIAFQGFGGKIGGKFSKFAANNNDEANYTDFCESEYVVYNPDQVKIRYLVVVEGENGHDDNIDE